jgi:hypothetical protein
VCVTGVLLVAVTAAAVGALAAPAAPVGVPRLVFPVVGSVTYHDDFGEPRAKWPHPGNDLVAPKRAIAVAAEAGKISFWTRSPTAGCMLYLYGASGTTYQYIHLNNDLTQGNDNRGTCVAGTAYAPGLADGDEVAAGQPIGFVGDSGDANGIHAHLHFEVHPGGGKAVDPYPYLRKARHLLFPADPETTVSLTAEGTVAAASADAMTLRISKLVLLPSLARIRVARALRVSVPPSAQIDSGGALATGSVSDLLPTLVGQKVVVLTSPTPATLDVALARPGSIAVARIAVGS